MKKYPNNKIIPILMGISVFVLGLYLMIFFSSLYDWNGQNVIAFIICLIVLSGLVILNAWVKHRQGKSLYKSILLHALLSTSIILAIFQISVSFSSVTPDSKTGLLPGYWNVGLIIAILFEVSMLFPNVIYRNNVR